MTLNEYVCKALLSYFTTNKNSHLSKSETVEYELNEPDQMVVPA